MGVINKLIDLEQEAPAALPEVMSVRQASEYMGVSKDTLYKYVAANKLPCFKLGNRWRFKKSILDRWMEAQCNGSGGKIHR